jgi:transcription elongation factor GreA
MGTLLQECVKSNKMNHDKEYLTQDKYNELEKELEHLRTVRRKEVAEDLEYAKQLGDLSENAEYHQAREEQAVLEDRIGKLDTLLKSAAIVNIHHSENVSIAFGKSNLCCDLLLTTTTFVCNRWFY